MRAASAARGAPAEALPARHRARPGNAGSSGYPTGGAGKVSFELAEADGRSSSPDRFTRALKVTRGPGASRAEIDLAWEARFGEDSAVHGIERLPGSKRDASVRVVLSMPLPETDGPVGVDLTIRAIDDGVLVGAATFPSLAYTGGRGRQMRGRFDR